jgi:D-alanyl-D-alanine carboxypeptidase
MQKKLAIIFLFLFLVNIFPTCVFAQDLDIHSPSAILIDSATGRILYEKNANEKMYPASITKIMTGILALEEGKLNDVVTASSNAVLSLEPGSSNIGILPGEEMTLEQLLQGLLIASANEAGNIIAEHISGSLEEFVKLMNQRAIELGAKNTHFVNACGLHDDNHMTTAYDMAMIARYAMTIPKFRELVNIDYMEMPPTNKYKEIRYLSNTNRLINRYRNTPQSNYLYEPAIGIKTGYTSKANHTLVAAAKKGNQEYITVVMDAKVENYTYYSYEDTLKLFKYGFENFSYQTIVKPGDILEESPVIEAKNNEHVILQADTSLEALLPRDVKEEEIIKESYPLQNIKAPVKKGDVLGFVSYKYKGETLGKVNLVADKNIEQDPIEVVKNKTLSIMDTLWFKISAGVVASVVLLSIVLIIIARMKRRRNTFAGSKHKISYLNRHRKW